MGKRQMPKYVLKAFDVTGKCLVSAVAWSARHATNSMLVLQDIPDVYAVHISANNKLIGGVNLRFPFRRGRR